MTTKYVEVRSAFLLQKIKKEEKNVYSNRQKQAVSL
jgi:hypothetical protein